MATECRWKGCQCPDDEPCTCDGCGEDAVEDSMFCERHVKVMRPHSPPEVNDAS